MDTNLWLSRSVEFVARGHGCGHHSGRQHRVRDVVSFDGVPGDVVKYLGPGAVVAALFVSFMKSRELYKPAELADLKQKMGSISIILLWGFIFLFLADVAFALKTGDNFSRGTALLFAGGGFGGLLVERIVLRNLVAKQP